MARYKALNTNPWFLACDLERQLLQGSFEHAVHHLLDDEFDLALFNRRYCNDKSRGDDLAVPLARAVAAGGREIMAKTDLGKDIGFIAPFADSEGNTVGLYSCG